MEENLPELSPQLIEDVEKHLAVLRTSELASTSARTNFHEKLAIVTAGSLTVVVTMATNISVKPFADASVTHLTLRLLAGSSILFFISLIASLLHNFVDTIAFRFDFLSEEQAITRKLLWAGLKEVSTENQDPKTIAAVTKMVRDRVESKFAYAQAEQIKKARTYRSGGRWLSYIALPCFVLGYLPAIVFVIYLVRT